MTNNSESGQIILKFTSPPDTVGVTKSCQDAPLLAVGRNGILVRGFGGQIRRLRGRDYSRPLASEPDVKVSLHPAQASRRPCEGPVSSRRTCWLYDTAPKSMPLRGR